MGDGGRFALLQRALWRPWPRRLLGAWLVLANYDTFSSQLVPDELSKYAPKLWQVIASRSDWLPWQTWLVLLALLIVFILLEYHYLSGGGAVPVEQQSESTHPAEENKGISFFSYQTNHGHIQINYNYVVNQYSTLSSRAFVKFRPLEMTVVDGLNVSRITTNAAGDYTIHFVTPMRSETLACAAIHPTPPFQIVSTAATEARIRFENVEPEIVAIRFDD